jgi:hypothetical protein
LRAENQHGRSVEDAELNRKSTEENRGWALAPGAMEISADQNTPTTEEKSRPNRGRSRSNLEVKIKMRRKQDRRLGTKPREQIYAQGEETFRSDETNEGKNG